ncbi:glycosyltransferase [Clostridium sp. D53t1_180928_C8]|uniref:glycosyltransferase family 32 protein n=1 Tax=Clostridium sp. D53t1_180928_C8 TaxID=2787101 RepID=UPI0018A8918A|nr:glycosyltransferase [Clostridium sp. D53t1_180928_C8]
MRDDRIPKVIHYCWFGKKEKPDLIKKCIKSWKEILIDYEIKEWNEDIFDINSNKFVKEAYEEGKYAFVSDYVRVYAIYNYGGIYLDTDVEVCKEFSEEILNNESFWGFEEKNFIATSTIGAKKRNKLIKRFLDLYENKSFIKENGDIDTTTNVYIVSNIIKELGVMLDGTYQRIDGLAVFYPQEYFSPYDYINCYSKKSENTYAIHHFYKSWLPLTTRIKGTIKKTVARIIGGNNVVKLRKLIIR